MSRYLGRIAAHGAVGSVARELSSVVPRSPSPPKGDLGPPVQLVSPTRSAIDSVVLGDGQARLRPPHAGLTRRAGTQATSASRRAAITIREPPGDHLADAQAVRVARRPTTRPLSAPSFDQLLARLVQADIRFVVIGGLALGSWGVIRGTKDCNIVPDPEPKNLDRLARLVVELGGHVQLDESLLGSERSIAAALRSGERALIATQLGDLDVVQGLDGVLPYAELRASAIDVELADVTIPVCALEHLRTMKRAAGRPRDLVDLDDLDAAQPPASD